MSIADGAKFPLPIRLLCPIFCNTSLLIVSRSLVHLDEGGYAKKIVFSSSDTSYDIKTKFLVAYKHIPDLLEHGFRLLCTEKLMVPGPRGQSRPKRGVSRLLRPLKRTEFDVDCLQL